MKANLNFGALVFLLLSATGLTGSLTVSTDKTTYQYGEPIYIMIYGSAGTFPRTLDFPTSCTADYTMDGGFYDSSDGVVCAFIVTSVQLPHTWYFIHNLSAYTPPIGTHSVTAYLHEPWTAMYPSNTAVFTVEIPLPDMQLIHPNGGEIYTAGSTILIRWTDPDPGTYDLDYSADNGNNWLPIVSGITGSSYEWAAPANLHSNLCRIKLSEPETFQFVISENVFTVFQCLDPPEGDLNGDCYINLYEFSRVAGFWLNHECQDGNNWCQGTDRDHSGTVDLADLSSFLDGWLNCSNPLDPSCL
jgi:hypothetical protein